MPTIVVVTGGRSYCNYARVCAVLDQIHKKYTIAQLHHGDAAGADTLAKEWALSRGVSVIPYPAKWRPNGVDLDRGAGRKRNIKMLQTARASILVAFPGGRGTAHCVEAAQDQLLVQSIWMVSEYQIAIRTLSMLFGGAR